MFVMGAQVAPLSVDRKIVVGCAQRRPTAATGQGWAEASQPALVLTMLQTDCPASSAAAA